MNCYEIGIKDVIVIEPKVYGDSRGWFTEIYSKRIFKENGIDITFVQENHSYSVLKGTIRGLHFQDEPYSQTKLVRCIKGKILDVAVDLRKQSKTFGKWIGVELSEDNRKQLLIPKGFAHGFLTLENDVEVQYLVDELYAPEYDRVIRFDDPDISVNWGVETPVLSDKDKNAPYMKEIIEFLG